MTSTILVIDDDHEMCELVELTLKRLDLKVETAHNATVGLRKTYALQPDLILLDIMMPGLSGWDVCSRIRQMASVPIIMMTALNSREDRIKGLDLGADDYVAKPFHLPELVARVQAMLRRNDRVVNGGSRKVINVGRVMVNLEKYEVTLDSQRVDLTPTEFKLLTTLARHKGKVLSHEFLLSEIWGAECINEMDYLRLYISYLRRKLEDDPNNPTLIVNEWGVGYRFG